MKSTFVIFLVLAVSSFSQVNAYSTGPPVKGVIDKVHNGKVYGWACQKYISLSISVHMYAGNCAGCPGGVFVTHTKAYRHSEPAVARSCSTGFNKYRFVIHLTAAQRRQFKNKKVYVHGISIVGNVPNSLLHHSGRFRIDPAPVHPGGFIPCRGRGGQRTFCQ